MRFYLHTGNHNSNGDIADTIAFLRCALQDCGHTAYVSPGIAPGQVHIVLEHFVEDRHLLPIAEGHAAGARFILIGTEPIVDGCFNRGIVEQHQHYSNADYWKLRFDSFRVAANYAEAIWVLAESMVDDYQRAFPNLPVRFLPHGYVSKFKTVRDRPECERDIDFYFSGAITEHREGILNALRTKHRVMYNHQGTPEYLRLDFVSRSKVCLALRLSECNDIPSVSRMHFHLLNKSYLLQEKYALACPLDPFVQHVPPVEFLDWAHAALSIPNRREIAEARHEQFRLSMPMAQLLPPLLDEVLASIGASSQRLPHHEPQASAPQPDMPAPELSVAAALSPEVVSPSVHVDSVIAEAGLNAIHHELSARQRDRVAEAMAKKVNALIPPSQRKTDPDALHGLRELGVLSLGHALSAVQAEEVARYFRRTPCYDTHVPTYSDGIARDVEAAARHSVYGSYKLREALMAPHLVELALNPDVLALCEGYLGCLPTIYSVHAWWTFAGHERPGVTHGFHRDQDDHRFLSMFIYLTDVPAGEGHIEVYAGTHRLDVVQQSLEDHARNNGTRNVLDAERFFPQYTGNGDDDHSGKVPIPYDELFEPLRASLTGSAGTAFIADTFALHRGTPPSRRHRLACWIRYGLAKHPMFVLDRNQPVPASELQGRLPHNRETDWVTRLIVDPTH